MLGKRKLIQMEAYDQQIEISDDALDLVEDIYELREEQNVEISENIVEFTTKETVKTYSISDPYWAYWDGYQGMYKKLRKEYPELPKPSMHDEDPPPQLSEDGNVFFELEADDNNKKDRKVIIPVSLIVGEPYVSF